MRKKRYFYIFLSTICVGTFFGALLQKLSNDRIPFDRTRVDRRVSTKFGDNRTKLILLYTQWFTSPWPGIKDNEEGVQDTSGNICPVSNCRITTAKGNFRASDAVIFHGVMTPHEVTSGELFKYKPKDQKWVWYEHENPVKMSNNYDVAALDNMIDITISYKRNSTIFVPYGYYVTKDEINKEDTNYAKDKAVGALWFVSNCWPKLRLQVAMKLAKYFPVHVFGDCAWPYFYWTPNRCPKGEPVCKSELNSKYKFYLAFENYNCQDYISEKYWHTLIRTNMVPILIAGVYNKELLIPGSYIDVLDFPGPKTLANYLHYLNSNDTAYNEYFRWRSKYEVRLWPKDWICKLCEILHSNHTNPPIHDFSQFWGIKENCYANDTYIYYKWLLDRSDT